MENLNYVDIFMVILFAIFIIDGFARGFIIAIINFFRSIVGYVLCFFASAKLTPIIYENYVKDSVYQELSLKLGEVANVDSAVSDIQNSVAELPDFLRDVVDISSLENVSNESTLDFIMSSIVQPVATTVIKMIVFAVVFALFFIITGVIISLIKKLRNKDKSALKVADRIAGGVLGLAKSGIVAFMVASVVNMIAPYATNTDGLIATAKASQILTFVNEFNPFNVIIGG